MSFLSVDAIFFSQIIGSIIGIIAELMILIYHGVSTYKYTKQKTNQCQICAPSLLLWSFVMLIIGIVYCISGLSEVLWTEHSTTSTDGRIACFVHFLLLLNCYGFFKLSMYMALCRRLVESYSDSSLYSYSNKFYAFWQIFLVIVSVIIILASCFHIEAQYNPQARPPCVINIPLAVVAVLIGYDVIVSTVNLLLFLKPLWTLTADLYDHNSKIRNTFKPVMYTNAILACVTIITSFFTWIFVYFLPGMEVMFQTIDIIVSSAAIILLFSRNHWIFRGICCCFKIDQIKQQPTPTTLRDLSNE
eukprot:106436_1